MFLYSKDYFLAVSGCLDLADIDIARGCGPSTDPTQGFLHRVQQETIGHTQELVARDLDSTYLTTLDVAVIQSQEQYADTDSE
jgi:hypothetical protein